MVLAGAKGPCDHHAHLCPSAISSAIKPELIFFLDFCHSQITHFIKFLSSHCIRSTVTCSVSPSTLLGSLDHGGGNQMRNSTRHHSIGVSALGRQRRSEGQL